LKNIYSLIWDDFCSWYLEWVKPGFELPVKRAVYEQTVRFFTELVHLLHPFMPFVTEELYHLLAERNDDLCVRQFGSLQAVDKEILAQGDVLKSVITSIRDTRVKNQLKPKESVKLYIETSNEKLYHSITTILAKQINAATIEFTGNAIPSAISVVVEKDRFYIQTEQVRDNSSQVEELKKELEYLKGFLVSINKKLDNEKFVQNAKAEVLALEQKKREDAETKIKIIVESLENLS
jgi:valyl-tRNA synthetase